MPAAGETFHLITMLSTLKNAAGKLLPALVGLASQAPSARHVPRLRFRHNDNNLVTRTKRTREQHKARFDLREFRRQRQRDDAQARKQAAE